MGVLTVRKTWRAERPAIPRREPDLTPEQTDNVRKALAYLRVRLGGRRALAKAAGVDETTLGRATRHPITLRTAVRLARAAKEPLERLLDGSLAREGSVSALRSRLSVAAL